MGTPAKSKISDITRIEESSKGSDTTTQWSSLKESLVSSIQSAKENYSFFWEFDTKLDGFFETNPCGLKVQQYYLEYRTSLTIHQMYSFQDLYTKDIRNVPVENPFMEEYQVVDTREIEILKEEILSDAASLEIKLGCPTTETDSSSSTATTDVDISLSNSDQSRISSSAPKASWANFIYSAAEKEACCEILLSHIPKMEGPDYAAEVSPEENLQLQQAVVCNCPIMNEETGPDDGDGSTHEDSERQPLPTEEKMETGEDSDDSDEAREKNIEDPNYFCYNTFLYTNDQLRKKLSYYMGHFTWDEFKNTTNLRTFLEKVEQRSRLHHLVNLAQKLVHKIKKEACGREVKLREQRYNAWRNSNLKFMLDRNKQLSDLKKALKKSKEETQERLKKESQNLIQKVYDLRQLLREKEYNDLNNIYEGLPENQLKELELKNILIDQCSSLISRHLENLKEFRTFMHDNDVSLSQSLQSESEIVDEESYAKMEGMESMLLKHCMEEDGVLWNQQKLIQTFIQALYLFASIDHPQLSQLAKDTLKILKRPEKVPRCPLRESPKDFPRKLKFNLDRSGEVVRSSDTLAETEEITDDCQNPLEGTSKDYPEASTSSLQLSEPELEIKSESTDSLSSMEKQLQLNKITDESSKDEDCKSITHGKSKTEDRIKSPPEKKFKK